MRTVDFNRLDSRLANCRANSTFKVLSSQCPLVANDLSKSSYLVNLSCLDADKIVRALMKAFTPVQAYSRHAVYVHNGDMTIVNFFADAQTNCVRVGRLYNFILSLVQNGILTSEECRQRVDAVCVAQPIKKLIRSGSNNLSLIHSRYERSSSAPWCYNPDDIRSGVEVNGKLKSVEADFRKLSGYIFRMVYYVFPQELDKFAQWCGWSN